MTRTLRFLITAGPTREAIDPVRFLSNRSSGKMGFALAQAAAEAGHEVTLIAGPVSLATPEGVRRVDVVSAQEMYEAVADAAPASDAAILAAAVADYRPASTALHKIKKSSGPVTLELERTRDILGSMRGEFGYRGVLAGFAAETESVLANALGKLERKGCDFLVANDVSGTATGFDSEDNEVTVLFPDREPLPLPRASKREIARELVRLAAGMARARGEGMG